VRNASKIIKRAHRFVENLFAASAPAQVEMIGISNLPVPTAGYDTAHNLKFSQSRVPIWQSRKSPINQRVTAAASTS
jgi:hypothetical protein